MSPNPAAAESTVEVHDQLADVLDRVERGETVTLLRNGRQVGKVVPMPAPPSEESRRKMAEALQELIALGDEIRRQGRGFTAEELRQFRDEGRP